MVLGVRVSLGGSSALGVSEVLASGSGVEECATGQQLNNSTSQ